MNPKLLENTRSVDRNTCRTRMHPTLLKELSSLDRNTSFHKKLFEILSAKWAEIEKIPEWTEYLENLGVHRYEMSAGSKNDAIMVWWDFVTIVNETPYPIYICRCPAGDWDDDDSPDMPILVLSKELAEKIVTLGFVPS